MTIEGKYTVVLNIPDGSVIHAAVEIANNQVVIILQPGVIPYPGGWSTTKEVTMAEGGYPGGQIILRVHPGIHNKFAFITSDNGATLELKEEAFNDAVPAKGVMKKYA